MSDNGKSLSLMTEQEFVDADAATSQRWTYRILCDICGEIKGLKKRSKMQNKVCSFAGGIVGGVAAYLATKVKIFGL